VAGAIICVFCRSICASSSAAFALLLVIFQRRLFHVQRGLRLVYALFINAIVDLEQHLSRLNGIEILHVHRGDVAIDLRADKSGLPADISIIGKLAMTGERGKLPGVQNNQYADDADRRGGKNRHHANVVSGIGLLLGRILLTHNDSRVKLSLLFVAGGAF
jgi:hypothetical protein